MLDQDDNNLYEIFSEPHDEIKRIIEKYKIEHKLSNSIENLNKVARKHGESKEAINVKYQALDSIPTAAIGRGSEVARRNSTGNLTKAFIPEASNISASLTNLNKIMNSFSQNSLSEDVFNHPTVKRNLYVLSSRAPSRSNSVSSLAFNNIHSSFSSSMDSSIAFKKGVLNKLCQTAFLVQLNF